MIELVDLRDWKKQKEIISDLYVFHNIDMSPRRWRMLVQEWNDKWANGQVDYCITHSNQLGFKATTDIDEALIAINDFRSRRHNMYLREKAIIDGFRSLSNYKIDFEEGCIR